MKKNYLKALLLGAGLLMGANAWAEDVYTIIYGVPTYAADGETINGVGPQTDFTTDDGSIASDVTSSDANGDKCTNAMPIGGTVLYSNPSFSKKFDSPATKGIVHFEANYTSTTNGQETWKIVDSNGVEIFGTTDCGYSNGNATKNWGFCNGEALGTGYFRQARKAHNRVVLDINLTTKKVYYTVLVSSGNNSYTTLTGSYSLPAAVSDVSGLTATKQSYYSYMDAVSLYNVYDNASSEYAWTLNYQLNGETVATEVGAGEEGSKVNAVTSIWADGQKYYVDAETTEFTIASGTNTFNVAVREAENWTYSIKAVVDGEDLLTIATSSVVEGESASYGYPQYVQKDGVLYVSTKQNSNPWWGNSFTPAANNESQSIAYTAVEEMENIVFCKEAEDIDGLTVVSGGNTDIRASNRKGGYAATEVTIATLTSGLYKIYGATYGNAGTTFNIKAGDNVVFTIATSGNPVHTEGDEFAVMESTDITIPAAGTGGNSPKMLDYIIIQRTGDVPTSVSTSVSTAGYATFSSTYPVSFEGIGLKAYIITGTEENGTTLSLSEVTSVPANTGVVLKGAAGDYEIPVVASSSTNVSANKLVAVSENIQTGKIGTYVLQNQPAEGGVGFYRIGEAVQPSILAGRAYLDMENHAKERAFFFNGDATAIETVEAPAAEDIVAIYSASGVEVKSLQKGLNIVVTADGKTSKVFVK